MCSSDLPSPRLLDRPRERLHLVVELHDLALLFDVDRRGRLDVVDAEDPRRGARDWTESSTVSAARVDTVRG